MRIAPDNARKIIDHMATNPGDTVRVMVQRLGGASYYGIAYSPFFSSPEGEEQKRISGDMVKYVAAVGTMLDSHLRSMTFPIEVQN